MLDIRVDSVALGAAVRAVREVADRPEAAGERTQEVPTGDRVLDEAIRELADATRRNGREHSHRLGVTALALRFAAARYEATERSVLR